MPTRPAGTKPLHPESFDEAGVGGIPPTLATGYAGIFCYCLWWLRKEMCARNRPMNTFTVPLQVRTLLISNAVRPGRDDTVILAFNRLTNTLTICIPKPLLLCHGADPHCRFHGGGLRGADGLQRASSTCMEQRKCRCAGLTEEQMIVTTCRRKVGFGALSVRSSRDKRALPN